MLREIVSDAFRNQTIAEVALEKADKRPEQEIIFHENEPAIKISSIVEEAGCLANSLRRLGMIAGDVISFQLPSWREAVAIDLAASILGLVVNPIIPIYREKELKFILNDANTKLLFIPEKFRSTNYQEMIGSIRSSLPNLEHVIVVRGAGNSQQPSYEKLIETSESNFTLKRVGADGLKVLMYTSGTTGVPKAVMHSQNTLCRAIDNTVNAWNLNNGDMMFMPSPVTHITGFANGMELPFYTDIPSLLMTQWDVNRAAELINEYRATLCISATPFLQELADYAERSGDGLPSLRLFGCGGAAVPPELIRRVHNIMDRCCAFRVYGSTEAPLVSTGFINPEEIELAATTDGKVTNWDVMVINDKGKKMSVGVDGELLVKGPAMMLGYKDPQQTDHSMTDGYFHTGDIGYVTTDKAVVITDRKKDLIIRGGENISAKEIEDVLHAHPDIREAAVVSMPHARLGEGVCAFLTGQSNEFGALKLTVADLYPFLSQSGLARQKWPEKVVVLDDFERTASGKIRKDLLRQGLRED